MLDYNDTMASIIMDMKKKSVPLSLKGVKKLVKHGSSVALVVSLNLGGSNPTVIGGELSYACNDTLAAKTVFRNMTGNPLDGR